MSIAEYNDAIVSVRDKVKDKEYSEMPHSIQVITHMYSNTKTPVPRFILNNEIIKRNNTLVIGYKCLNCSALNEITLNLYIRKVSKHVRCCDGCKNLNEIKRAEHIAYMKGERIVEHNELRWSDKSFKQRLDESALEFDAKDEEFKTSYFLKHLTLEEFTRVQSKIVSIGNGKLKDMTNWEYFPTYRIHNQTQFTPLLVNQVTNAIEKLNYIEWNCEVCDSNFLNRDIEVQKNKLKILCKDCAFCNRVFKVKTFTSPSGKINYQSQPELALIKWCISNNMKITNGPSIEYVNGGKIHKYKVDFQLPEKKMLIEVKDNHIWHKKQIESGKWTLKEQSARKWCVEREWQYEIIFPKTLAQWKERMLKL